MFYDSITLNDWVETYPSLNPFTGCRNVELLGGSDLMWEEFKYRYGERELYDQSRFALEVSRVFLINEYKFTTMLRSLNIEYSPLDNYLVEKIGAEQNNINTSKNKTGTETTTPNLTTTKTPTVTTTTTVTPTLKTKETTTPDLTEDKTFTPTTEDTSVETPTVKTKTTETPRVSKTTTTRPADYTDNLSKTTFDDTTNLKAVQSTSRIYDDNNPETVTESTPNGTNESISEVVSGNTTTKLSHTGNDKTVTKNTGTSTKVTEYLSGNNTTQVSHSGTETDHKTGTEQTTFNTSVADTGTETLTFVGRKDKGYMYRNPQDAIRDEREIAAFSLIDVILKDVEQATLLSVY